MHAIQDKDSIANGEKLVSYTYIYTSVMPKYQVAPYIGFGGSICDTGKNLGHVWNEFLSGPRVVCIKQSVHGIIIVKIKRMPL